MARPREFDPEQALEKAMDVFWDRGYGDASLPDLLDGMGLSRGSLYKAYKDKKTLFLQALDRYDAQVVTKAVDVLTDPCEPDGWARIETVFENAVRGWKAGDRRGCLLCSAAAGPASSDTDIAAAVAAGLERLRQGFAVALGGAAAPQAQFLVAQYVGLRVLCRSDVAPDIVQGSIDALKALRPV